ncbi:MAG: Gfo/Idh/MocA family oxidoreductase [Pirellulaceae bacterium]|nr:Gfo/Idh/MocA family oxidoreductase [Pirellulaceae bacterium]
MSNNSPRRQFLKSSALVGTSLAFSAVSYQRILGANERLRVASIGTGGKGWGDLTAVAASPAVDVVGLCDIDSGEDRLGQASEKYPQAATYADWRRLLDDSKRFDAAIVSTPDFMHAPIGLAAMHLGKHIYCQKPLTHTLYEARQMQNAATKFKVVTQMGNQIQSHTAYRTSVAMVQKGLIGQIKSVHSWQSGTPKWPRAIERPDGADPIPGNVRWDLWQGVAGERPFKEGMYHPFSWRGWQEYGTGQLGDFGCHILDPVFTSLKLSAPISMIAEAPAIHRETWTNMAVVKYVFPKTEYTLDPSLPVTWYDGEGLKPPRELFSDIPESYPLPSAGSVLIGTKGSLVIPHVATPKLFPEEKFESKELPNVAGVDHYVQWADACRGVGTTTSHFGYSGPLTETVMLGTIAIRLPGTQLKWNASQLQVTGSDAAQWMLNKHYRTGWEPAWV